MSKVIGEHMTSERLVQAVARHLATRLHKSTSGFRCRCGACRHQVASAALRSGVDVRVLVAALPPEATPRERDGVQSGRRRPLTEQVATSMTVTRGRHRLDGPGAILGVLSAD